MQTTHGRVFPLSSFLSFSGLCVVVLALAAAPPTFAADTVWTGSTDAQWNTAANWDNGVPTSGVNAFLNAPATPNNVITLPGGAIANQFTVTGSSYSLTTGTLTLSDQLYVYGQNARLDIIGGASVSAPNGSIGIGSGDAGNTLSVASTLSIAGTLNVGYEGTGNTLAVQGGGSVTGGSIWVGGLATTSSNSVTIASGATLGPVNQIVVGYGGSTNGLFSTGGSITSTQTILGNDATADGNTGRLTAASSWTNSGGLTVGLNGSGNQLFVGDPLGSGPGSRLSVTGSASDVVIGANAGADGNFLVVAESGTFSSLGTLVVGQSGTGNGFVIGQGATVTSNNVRLGLNAGSVNNIAAADGAGTTWNIAGKLRVGSAGDDNSFVVQNGASVTVASDIFVGGTSFGSNVGGNSILVTGSGSLLTITSTAADLVIGFGTGTNNSVTVADAGTLNVSSIRLGPGGTLQVGNGTAAGTVNPAATIDAPFGGGTVAFDHNEANYLFANTMSGSLAVVHAGPGRTILTGTNTYTGNTTITSGTLALQAAANNIASSGTIAVGSVATLDVSAVTSGFTLAGGQTLAGAGQVVGATEVAVAANLTPGTDGTIGTLSFADNLTILGGLKIDLSGATSDLVDVSGDALTLGAGSVLDLTSLTSLSGTAFVIASYGTLTGEFGTVNGLPTHFWIDYDYLGGNQIAVVVPETSSLALAGIGLAALARRWLRRRTAAAS